jgi:hypothetical protein
VLLFYKIAKDCAEAASKADTLAMQLCNLRVPPDIKVSATVGNASVLPNFTLLTDSI